MNNEAIGRFLWALRREKGWKQQEAAARLLRDAAGEQLCAAGQAAEYLERLGAFEA